MRVLRWIGLAIAALAVTIAALFGVARFLDGPLGPIPGGPLRGAVTAEAPGDWSFAGDAPTLELQVGRRSLTVWFVSHEGTLWIAASEGARKRWPAEVQADGRVRVRTAGRLYDVKLARVEDADLRRAAGEVFRKKYDVTISPEDGQRVWFFRAEPGP
jgi:hypothetical protein